jgi:hypothetical protein
MIDNHDMYQGKLEVTRDDNGKDYQFAVRARGWVPMQGSTAHFHPQETSQRLVFANII